ncbi:hypothetical protein Tco_0316324 [Tanacetum coccineum]
MMRDDEQLRNADIAIWLSLKIKFEKITTTITCRSSATRLRDHDNYQDDDAHLEGKSSVKRQKTSKHGIYSLGESSSGQTMENELNPSRSLSQDLWEEILDEIDEARLRKVVDDMLRQR